MAGNRAGGMKTAAKIKAEKGEDWFKIIGAKGGSNIPAEKRHFSIDRKAASAAGQIGGSVSRRPKASSPNCRNGHPRATNSVIYSGKRYCKACNHAKYAKYYKRKKAAA